MPRFFVENAGEEAVTLTGENARHAGRSLRMKAGESLTVVCGGEEYDCVITGFSDSEVYCSVIDRHRCESEPLTRLTLFQAMPKGDKAEFIVQKAVELGVSEIVFVMTGRCVSRPDEKSFAKRRERLMKISLEAAKQCGRGIVPEIRGIISFDDMLENIKGFDNRAKSALYSYDWPGNIRELRNCVESAVVMASGDVITVDDLPPAINTKEADEGIKIPLGVSLDEAERMIIEQNLAANKNNKSKTAEILGIGRKTLSRKLEEWGIE